jgi:hypothetical protein
VRKCSARQLAVLRVHLLHLVCPGWARTPILLLLLHTIGVVRPSAPSPFTALHHAGDDLCGHAAIGVPVQALLCAALFQKEDIPHQRLLLRAQDQRSSFVHRQPHPLTSGTVAGMIG